MFRGVCGKEECCVVAYGVVAVDDVSADFAAECVCAVCVGVLSAWCPVEG